MKCAAVFPGSGSQYPGMGKELYHSHRVAKDTFDEADDILKLRLSQACFDGNSERLHMNNGELLQPSIYVLSVALYRLFYQQYGFRPSIFAGHSLGEYAALTCSGILNYRDGVNLVYQRGKAMQEVAAREPAGMIAVSKLSLRQVERVIRKVNRAGNRVFIAAYNSPGQYAISGYMTHFDALNQMLELCGGRVDVLNTKAASHCPIMESAMKQFSGHVKKIRFNAISAPVVSNLKGVPYAAGDNLAACLCSQMVEPVQWQRSILYMLTQDIGAVVEVGPNVTLKKITEFISKEPAAYALDDANDWQTIRRKFNVYNQVVSKCVTIAVSTPNRNYDDQNYQESVAAPFSRLIALAQKSEYGDASESDAQAAIGMTQEMLEGKNTPPEELKAFIRKMRGFFTKDVYAHFEA